MAEKRSMTKPDSQNDAMFDVLEKMIDSQISNTESLTSFNQILHDCKEKVNEIEDHFTNGFRSELKDYIRTELNKQQLAFQAAINVAVADITKVILEFKRISFWIKIIFGGVVAIGSIAVAIEKIVDLLP